MPAGTIPFLINLIVAIVFGVVVWGLWRLLSRSTNASALIAEPPSDMLIWLLAVAAFTFGIFVAYVWARP